MSISLKHNLFDLSNYIQHYVLNFNLHFHKVTFCQNVIYTKYLMTHGFYPLNFMHFDGKRIKKHELIFEQKCLYLQYC